MKTSVVVLLFTFFFISCEKDNLTPIPSNPKSKVDCNSMNENNVSFNGSRSNSNQQDEQLIASYISSEDFKFIKRNSTEIYRINEAKVISTQREDIKLIIIPGKSKEGKVVSQVHAYANITKAAAFLSYNISYESLTNLSVEEQMNNSDLTGEVTIKNNRLQKLNSYLVRNNLFTAETPGFNGITNVLDKPFNWGQFRDCFGNTWNGMGPVAFIGCLAVIEECVAIITADCIWEQVNQLL